ncbi:MAG: hypothetical protein PHQ23_17205, partial [Candidatus Wallbacteria bacterium]|nr:hypothetical protein [Candidatus Wallbacteria bacterium]
GNLGIGTSNPGYKLDVNGTGRFSGDVTITDDLTVNGSILGGLTATGSSEFLSGSDTSITIGASATSDHSLVMNWDDTNQAFSAYCYGDSASEGLSITSTEFFGIGTNDPKSKLHLKNENATTHTDVNANGLIIENTSTGIASQISFKAANTSGISTPDDDTIAKIGALSVSTSSSHYGEIIFSTRNGTDMYERVRIDQNGLVGINTDDPQVTLDVNADSIRVRTSQSPASSGTGIAGEIAWDSEFLYICTAANTWRKVAHSSY